MRQFYISKNNKNVGPMAPEQLVQQGLTPNSMVWAEGMPTWVPASQVPELAPYLAAATRPQFQQPYQQPSYQRPAQPTMSMPSTTIFQYVLYGILAFAAIVGLLIFINSFTFFNKLFNGELTLFGIFTLFTSLLIMALSVVIALRIAKKQRFGFLSFVFFGITFFFGLLDLIILKWSFFLLLMIVGLLGIACTIFAVIPMNKLGGPGFKALLADKESSDIALVVIYGILMVALLIIGATKEHLDMVLDNWSLVKTALSAASAFESAGRGMGMGL